jgi:sugar phosphate isomerase/epimerase
MKTILFALFSAALCGAATAQDLRLAVQAYTFRDRTFVETVETARRLGLKYIEAYPGQRLGAGFEGTTDYNTITPDTLSQLKTFIDASGLKVVAYGVTGAASDAQWNKLMAFAKVLGIGVIQIEASNDRAKLDLAEKAADASGVKVALHNHRQAEGLPAAMLKQLEGRGKNIGAGADIGHWMCANTRPLDGVRLLKGRFVALHLVDVEGIADDAKLRPVPYGSGKGEIKAVLDELRAQGFKGYLTLEYEHMSPSLELEVAACVRWFSAYQAGLLDKNDQLPVANVPALWSGFAKTGKPATWEVSDTDKEQAELNQRLAGLKPLEIVPASVKGNKSGYGDHEGPAKGVGSNQNAKYCQLWDGKAFLTCSLAAPAAAAFYTLSSSNDNDSRDPREWALYGSADGQTWKELDRQKDQSFGERFHLKGYAVKQPEAFQHYKLEILAHGGDKDMQFSRFALYGAK